MKRLLALTLMMALLTSVVVSAEETGDTVETTNVAVPTLYNEEADTSALPTLINEEEDTSALPTLINEEVDATMVDGGIMPELIGNEKNQLFSEGKVLVGTEEVVFDQGSMVKEGVLYLPLRHTLEALGFTVSWDASDKSIEVMNGARYTKLYIDRNYYTKNKMAPVELSGAPFVSNGRTLVPLEFFYLILDESFEVESNEVHFNSDMMAIHSGYIQSIETDETGGVKIVISTKEVSEELYDQTYIHTNANFTVYQKDIVVGDFINVLTSPIMAMSMPGQTGGFVIY